MATDDELESALDLVAKGGGKREGQRHLPLVESGLYAILLARAISARPALLADLDEARPSVTILETGSPDHVKPVINILKVCALPQGTDFSSGAASTPSRPSALLLGEDADLSRYAKRSQDTETMRAIRRGACVIHISSGVAVVGDSVRRYADHVLRLPDPDSWSISLLARAIFGNYPSRGIGESKARRLTPLDVTMAWRRAKDADDAIRLLETLDPMKGAGDAARGARLSDLPGYGEARIWGLELAEDLAALRDGRITWAQVSHKGLLLSGPPGTGKTTYARALALEAGVPLVATSVAEWIRAEHLGVTLDKMKKAFISAMASAPSILFIDELDGIGDRRTTQSSHSDYWSQVVNSLLELLAGVEDREGVIVLGATNLPDRIDPAIRRSGRLDHHIEIPLPDMETLQHILRHHLGDDLRDVRLGAVAMSMTGRSGADVEALVRRARGKARREARKLSVDDLLSIRQGDMPSDTATLRRIAIHESGHAIVAWALGHKVRCMAIIPEGGVARIELTFDGMMTVRDLERSIVIGLAGRAAEELEFGEGRISIGSEDDIRTATASALDIEVRFGVGALGHVHLSGSGDTSLLTLAEVRHAVRNRIAECFARAKRLISDNASAHSRLAEALAARTYLSETEVLDLIEAGQQTTVKTDLNHGGERDVA
jgi:DNA polymerase III delta prime subunit